MKLEEIRALCESATPGPWTIRPRDIKFYSSDDCTVPDLVTFDAVMASKGDFLGAKVVGPEEPGRATFTTVDAYFIAVSRSLMPRLLKVAEAAKALRDCPPPDSQYEWNKLEEALAELEGE